MEQKTSLHICSYSFHLMIILILITPYVILFIPNGEDFWNGMLSLVSFGIFFLRYKDSDCKLRITLADVSFAVCVIYFLFNARQPIDLSALMRILTLLGLWLFFRQEEVAKSYAKMSWYIIIFTSLQALIMLLQHTGCLPSCSTYFLATGTLGNPAPLGCYLSIGFVILLSGCFFNGDKSKWHKLGYLVCFPLLVCSIILVDSRAAWMGIFFSLCVLYYYRDKKRRRLFKFVILVSSILALFFIMHQYRPESSNARLRIWKVCSNIIKKAPLAGHGTSSFTSTYMLEQTNTISEAPEEIRRMADNVNVAYNEAIMILCEQGVVGLLLVVLFFLIVIRNLWRNFKIDNQNCLVFPVIAILTISQFSYPFSILSINAILITIISVGQNSRNPIVTIKKHKIKISALIILSLLISISELSLRIYTYNRLGKYLRLESRAVSVLDNSIIGWYIKHNPNLLMSNAKAQMMVGDNEMAISSILCVLKYKINASWYIYLGDMYMELENFNMADYYYTLAHNIQPGLLEPIFARFQIWRCHDSQKAMQLALKIRDTFPKIENKRTNLMKEEAIKYINNHTGVCKSE